MTLDTSSDDLNILLRALLSYEREPRMEASVKIVVNKLSMQDASVALSEGASESSDRAKSIVLLRAKIQDQISHAKGLTIALG